ncbi:SdrD B-like domain-containing protein [Microbacterium caowuchunii]|nr:SdrD B-like domain-containing protein [Microbacterium caowuchunii]
MKKFLSGLMASMLALTLVVGDVISSGASAVAATGDTPSITLNGTVGEGDSGYLTSKSVILSSGNETKVNYRLVPNYATGQATDVRVTLFMPSLDLVGGEYQVVPRDAAPTPMGVQGRVSSGGEWNVISDTTVKGGPIVLEYSGDLRAGANPAFDVFLTTYNDGSNGTYGGVPEGTAFEINGFVSYELFDRKAGTAWQTPNQLDDDSRVAVISSDLKWDTTIAPYAYGGASTAVPMWDRYQYFDYVYALDNVSTNPASDIDGYSVTFDIDTTDHINGIIPFDINRFVYGETGEAVPNADPEYREGEFIGVPGEGGVLIYDVTDWDGESELTEEIPYTYSGAGMIIIDREHGDQKQGLTPGVSRKYMVSLPMSRQGFPNLPTNFKLTAITNILFAKSANWTKTRTAVREVTVPTYALTFTHAPEKASVVEGEETHTRINGIANTSNAPIFDASLVYTVDEKFTAGRVVYEFDESMADSLGDASIGYIHTDRNGVEKKGTITGDLGENTLTFDVSELEDLDWNRELLLDALFPRLDPGETLPLTITVYGSGPTAGRITQPAVATFHERYASNEDYSQATEYTDVAHTTKKDATFEIVEPKPQDVLKPVVDIIGIYGDRRTRNTTLLPYEAPFQAEYQLGTTGVDAATFAYTIETGSPSQTPGSLTATRITLTEALTGAAEDVRITFIDEDGNEESTADVDVALGDLDLDGIARIIISGKRLNITSAATIAVVDYDSTLGMGASQALEADFSGTQVPPDEAVRTANTTNTVSISEAKTTVKMEGLNQVTRPQGAGNAYDQWVERQWYCGYSGCGSKWDYTLDQGYKSLGGFATSITRPTETYRNNDQTTVIDVTFPAEQFDMYYMKIRDDLKPYLQTIDIHRTVDGEETLWKTIDAKDWAANTREGSFWRIATADPDAADLYATYDTVDAEGHSYYKGAFAEDVAPESPVSKVTLTLDFERTGANDTPQLQGTTGRVIEYMGRFYETSEEGKKLTSATVVDTIGRKAEITRTATSVPIHSIVGYPFAQSSTGAQDTTSTSRKTVSMGSEASYLASIRNINTASWYAYNGHGPDIHSPVWTEFDEWLYHYDPASFHDRMSYHFTYPANPNQDADVNFEATQIVLPNTSTLQYLTELRIDFDDKTAQTLAIDDALRAQILTQPELRIVYDDSLAEGFHQTGEGTFAVSAGAAGIHPLSFEAFFEEVNGFGDNTAELKGVTGDLLGTNLSEIDVRVVGIVNGNKDLVGKTTLYREPDDSARTAMHTSQATLVGATPTLGATMDMSFDALSVYDYAVDGITPNTSTVQAGMANSAQADITGFTMNLALDAGYRSQTVAIPGAVFDGDWKTQTVTLVQPGGKRVDVELDRFELDETTGRYELDLRTLFEDGTLNTVTHTVTFGGTAVLQQQVVSNVIITFAAARDGAGQPLTRMWGSFAREADPALSARMIPESYVFVTGDWVDETAAGHDWDSKPSYRTQGAKVSTASLHYSSFTVSGSAFESPQRFTANAGGGNGGMAPSYRRYDGAAPVVSHRLTQMEMLGMHLNEDLSRIEGSSAYLFDADSNERIAASHMVVGDTSKVLYELRNSAPVGGAHLPIFEPSAHFTAPKGLDIAKVTVVVPGTSAALDAVIAAAGRTSVPLSDDQHTISGGDRKKRTDVVFTDVTVAPQESVFILVEYVAVNDYSAQLGDTQYKSVQPYSYSRPGYQHHIQNYIVSGTGGGGVSGATSATGDYDGDGTQEHLARVHTSYVFTNPHALIAAGEFTEESLSGSRVKLHIRKISNEIVHSNTHATLDITLDTRARGFQLTRLPEPTYPADFEGEFDEPRVLIRVGDDWVAYDEDAHDLAELNQIRVDYGIVPARGADGGEFRIPDFTIDGTGHWQPYGGAATKSSQITSRAQLVLTHHDGSRDDNPAVASYKVVNDSTLTIYKAIPVVEFNLQSFDTSAEADAEYTDASAAQVGKTSYLPGDDVHVKLTARNADTAAATHTGYGKAPLRDPVIIDKLPEYISAPLAGYVHDGELDVATAVAKGDLTIRHFGRDGRLREDVALPEVTVTTVKSRDVGGAQRFVDDRKNDAYGLLSSVEPAAGKANAKEIAFQTFTYTFTDDLGRGERIEIMYPGRIREDDLPYATYQDGRAVFAPFMGWYSGNNPVAGNMHQYDMDMAALLHDAGISGSRGHEMTPGEFLSQSFSWQSGSNTERRHPGASSSTLETHYDSSANSMYSHRAYLHERGDNRLFEGATSGEEDDNFAYVGTARVNDGTVSSDERILWAQDNLQLNRAWLYGASEMLPDTERKASGQDPANFYEFDGSLKAPDNGLTPYSVDSFVYAVQLHEQFTVRLHSANLGDRAIESGVEYLEVLPVGITPYDEDGKLLGVTAYDGAGNAIPDERVTIEVEQTPADDKGYQAPAQKQEAGTHGPDTLKDAVPYVIRVKVAGELGGMFNQPTSTMKSKYQHVDIRVQVEDESTTLVDGRFFWYDELTVTTIDEEEYLAVYDARYGALDRAPHVWNPNEFPNDGMKQGFDLLDLSYTYSSYTSYFSMEPYGMYISGINSQGTTVAVDEKPAIVNGDHIAMRAPTLRVWSNVEKDAYAPGFDASLQNLTVDLYEEFSVHAIVENQQVEAHDDYFASAGYTNDRYTQQPQTTGGARGTWFDPTVTVTLPYGIVPVLENGDAARYPADVADQQAVAFTAHISDVTYRSSTPVADVSEHLNVEVERVEDGQDERYVLHFTAKDTAAAKRALHEIAFGQSLTVSPRVRVIDVPEAADASKYQQIITLAGSERPSFKAVVVAAKPTGSVPSGAPADSRRLDSTSTWSSNMGVQKVTERLISATQTYSPGDRIALRDGGEWKADAATLLPDVVSAAATDNGAYGGTRLVLRQPTIVNTTKAGLYADGTFVETQLVDAAGRFWVSTDIENRPAAHSNPYERIKAAGDVHNSRFIVSDHITTYAQRIGDPVLVVDGEVLDRVAFEARGYTVRVLTSDERDGAGERQLIQWLVTTPAGANGTRGRLATGENVTLRHQMQLVDGHDTDEDRDAPTWKDASLTIDSYVSVVADDTDLIDGDQRRDDFIVQDVTAMHYETAVVEATAGADVDGDGERAGHFAQDDATIEIIKPRGEVRVNTTRPRLLYSNGLTGDPYFNSSDTIEYLVTYAKNTGSGLKQMSFEHTLPTHESHDPETQVSVDEMDTTLLYVTSGTWELPAETLQRLEFVGKTVDEVFETEVYISTETAEAGYEDGEWVSLGRSSILTNTTFDVPAADRLDQRKVRVVVRSLDADFLVPRGTRLAVDADAAAGAQEVTETDPDNRSVTEYPPAITDNAMKIGMRAASARKATMFIYDTVQMWGNYVADAMMPLDQSDVRSYLTPSRPVVNVFHDALYYRSDGTRPIEERYGWSDNTAIKPDVSPHLKFHGEVVNADESMWDPDTEGDTYAEDTLIDPTITFELPAVMAAGTGFTYVPSSDLDADHPLSDDHRSRYSLTDADAYLWTWKLVRADGSEASADSYLTHTGIHTGSWTGMDRNVVTVWFQGMIYPGDKIVIDFIGKIDAYTPGAQSDDLKSKVYVTNSTGLVQPLNSDQNGGNRLGYMTDRHDLDGNGLLNDRLVFAERVLFEYETYDNFGKRKVSSSDLNRAGTVWPQSTPVREGGSFTYQLSLDNTKEAGDAPYPYPIMYDVLPHAGDTAIMNANTARNSMGSSLLDLDSVTLSVEGEINKTYTAKDYTVYVGPFTMQSGRVVPAEMVAGAVAGTEAFYDSLGTPGTASAVRDAHFVTMTQFRAAVATEPELLSEARTILTLFNSKDAALPGQSKLTLTYDMRSPLNAPVFLETWQAEGKPEDVVQWNSFVGTQRKTGFKPQESNNAGTYVTERAGSVSIGNYVWHDANYNAKQDEGEPHVDGNGRALLKPTKDIDFDGTIDDPGIDGVRVTLLSPNGRLVDAAGNSVVQKDGSWVVVDDETGDAVTDDLGQTTASTGALVTTTRTDIHGNAGYYVFSNIAPGEYRVMFEFPKEYDRFSVTTQELVSGAGVTVYEPGVPAGIPAANDTGALVALTSVEAITEETVDEIRMGFDIGIGRLLDFGGVVWNDVDRDGVRDPGEDGLEGYTVTLKDAAGETVTDINGRKIEQVSAADDGSYLFTVLPRAGGYFVQVTHPGGAYDIDWPVSPILTTFDPFARADDNDAFVQKRDRGERVVRTNEFVFDLESIHRSGFAARQDINAAFYGRRDTAVIGNRVWDDQNRDGIQDAGEPGIAGQTLELEQYEQAGAEWVRNAAFTRTAVSGEDGYYFFPDVPAFRGEDTDATEYRYQVVVKELVSGYALAPAHRGEDAQNDSNFLMNGTMHEGAVGDHLISLAEKDGEVMIAVDDITIDLGLISHATGVIAGEVFIDAQPDGIKTGDDLAAERYTATLQVSIDGTEWADVASQVGVNQYRFEGLQTYDEAAKVLNQYRVVVTEIPLWLPLTAHGAGADDVDSDFVEVSREGTSTAVSDSYVLAEEVEGHLLPVDTRTALTHEDVDLGLVEPAVVLGGRVWEDADHDGLQDEDEQSIAGQTVTLWERIDGEWVEVEDLDGRSSSISGDDGRYSFRVSPTHYDEGHPLFLQPREYRVTSDRHGYQEWSPARVGDDRTVDSDVTSGEPEEGPRHRGYTEPFVIADVIDGRIDVASIRDDRETDLGLKTHDHLVVIGGTIWTDSTEDGERQDGEAPMAGRTVTLWERVGGEWTIVPDATGASTRTTDAHGRYAFTVAPTDYDVTSDGYLLPREYRTTVAVPPGHRLSTGAGVTATLDGARTVSVVADIVTVDADGNVIMSATRADRTLDFAFAAIPLAITGTGIMLWVVAQGLALVVLGILLVGIQRRRKRAEETAA